MASGVKRIQIGALSYGVSNALIIGIICAKKDVKTFSSKKADNALQGVLGFTLRDLEDSINATVWTSAEEATRFSDMFNVGDVVEIVNPRVAMKPEHGYEANNNPTVTSSFHLTLQESVSNMSIYYGPDAEMYRDLLHMPIKPADGFLRLSDISAYGEEKMNDHADLLVAVRSVGELKTVKSRIDSSELFVREVVVMDETHSEFYISLWQDDAVNRCLNWLPRMTILFFADLKLVWSDYRKTVTGRISPRTIITEDPQTAAAEILRKFASTAPIKASEILDDASKKIDVSDISTVLTTAYVLDASFGGNKYTALLYAFVTKLNLDGPENQVIAYQCTGCWKMIEDIDCTNVDCLLNSQVRSKPTFKLDVELTDHRGTLLHCRLVSPAADEIFNCSADDFLRMSSESRTNLKWRFLLTRCEVRIIVLRSANHGNRPLISILSCSPADPLEASAKLPLF